MINSCWNGYQGLRQPRCGPTKEGCPRCWKIYALRRVEQLEVARAEVSTWKTLSEFDFSMRMKAEAEARTLRRELGESRTRVSRKDHLALRRGTPF